VVVVVIVLVLVIVDVVDDVGGVLDDDDADDVGFDVKDDDNFDLDEGDKMEEVVIEEGNEECNADMNTNIYSVSLI